MPCETGFAESFQESQEDLERREGNAHKRRTMQVWKNGFDEVWTTRPIEATRKIIDRQTKIMKAIIDADGKSTRL